MSPKAGFWQDTFEQLVKLGASTAKKTTQSVTQTFSPLKIVEKIVNTDSSQSNQPQEKQPLTKDNHTLLNFEKLQKKYQEQDEQKTAVLRQRLFQLVRSAEEKVLIDKKQKEIEEQRREIYEQQEKRRREEERKRQEQTENLPQGKIRRSIFSPKKIAKRQQAEVKPAAYKQ